MRIKVATSKPSKNVILIPQSREKNLGSFLGPGATRKGQRCFALLNMTVISMS